MFTVLAAINNDAVFQITINILNASENRCQEWRIERTFARIQNLHNRLVTIKSEAFDTDTNRSGKFGSSPRNSQRVFQCTPSPHIPSLNCMLKSTKKILTSPLRSLSSSSSSSNVIVESDVNIREIHPDEIDRVVRSLLDYILLCRHSSNSEVQRLSLTFLTFELFGFREFELNTAALQNGELTNERSVSSHQREMLEESARQSVTMVVYAIMTALLVGSILALPGLVQLTLAIYRDMMDQGFLAYSVTRVLSYGRLTHLLIKAVFFACFFGVCMQWALGFMVGFSFGLLEQSKILIGNFEWKNPSKFKDSPYFLFVKEISISISLLSVVTAYVRGTYFEVGEIKLDSFHVYMERTQNKEDGLNLWAAIGIEKNEEKKNSVLQNISSASSLHSDNEPQVRTPPNPSQSNEPTHFGVPYLLEIDRVLILDVRLHTQDYLTAGHVRSDSNNTITIPVLFLDRKVLTRPPVRRGQYRRGIYLDTLVWKVVGSLISELFATNKFEMMALVTNAAANHVTEVAQDAAQSVASVFTKLFQKR
eukprot:gene33438-43218_t